MPVFNFDQSAFPLLTPQQTSPLGGVLSDAIAKRLAMAKMESAENEAPYAGISKLGKALSEAAYAGAVTPQWAAKLASHPEFMAQLTNDQQNQLLTLMGNQSTNPIVNSLFTKLSEQIDKTNRPQPSLGSLISNLFTPQNQQNVKSTQNQSANFPSNVLPGVNLGKVDLNSGDQNDQRITSSSYSENVGNLKGEINKGTTLGTEQGKQLAELESEASNAPKIALSNTNLIESMKQHYNKAILKGPLLGKFAGYGPEASQALKDANNLQVSLAESLFGRNSTDFAKAQAGGLKLSVQDPDKALNHYAEKLQAENDRLGTLNLFYQTARQLGIKNSSQIRQMWFDYNKQMPPYDYKKQQVLYENLGADQEGFAEFIKDEQKNMSTLQKRINATLKKSKNMSSQPNKRKWEHLSDEELARHANGQ